VLRQVTVFTGVAFEKRVLRCDVIAACCVAALGAVLLGTARSKHRSPTAAQHVFGREAFSGRLPSSALLLNSTMG
jgi:hypothetical protein